MKDYFFLAFNNLKRRKLRSWLTMIGIFIGIAAVVALISLGQGLQNAIEEQFEQLGSDKIIIQPKGMMMGPGSATGSLKLTSKDLKVIENVRGVKYASGYLIKPGQAKYKGESGIGYATGLTEIDFEIIMDISGLEIIDGRGLKDTDKLKVVVGYNHIYKEDTWKKPMRIGSTIEIEGYEFKVIGVVSKVGNPMDDNLLYVQKETLKEILNVEDEESQIVVKTAKGFDTKEVADTIKRKLRQSRGEKEDQETFTVQTSEQLLESFSNIFGIVQAVLIGIASISLLVGGIGIMNTMYTSVLERTKEIGTMKAVGAKNSDILFIFLFESGLLGLVGGAIGICIGIGLGKGAEYIASIALGTNLLQAAFPWYLIGGALAFSFLTGTLSGILPAMQAARLRPAEALRYE
jgi:putative ABC transport system permease protein